VMARTLRAIHQAAGGEPAEAGAEAVPAGAAAE
jgi:hypothetical protein